MMRNIKKLFVILSFIPTSVWALEIGELSVLSYLDQNLQAELPLKELNGLNTQDIRVRLASAQEFEQAGIDFSEFLSNLNFKIISKTDQEAIVQIKSDWPLIEPYLNFILDITWGAGHFLKEFAVLVDPLELKLEKRSVSSSAPVSSSIPSATSATTATIVSTAPVTNMESNAGERPKQPALANASAASVAVPVTSKILVKGETVQATKPTLSAPAVPAALVVPKTDNISKNISNSRSSSKIAQSATQAVTQSATQPPPVQSPVQSPVQPALQAKAARSSASWVPENKPEKKSLELLPEQVGSEVSSVGQRLEMIENMLHNLAENNKMLREKQHEYQTENHSLQSLLNTKEIRLKQLEKAFESKEKANLLLSIILGIVLFGVLISLVFLMRFKKIKTSLK